MSTRTMSTEHKIREYFGGKVLSGRCAETGNPMLKWNGLTDIKNPTSIGMTNRDVVYSNGHDRLLYNVGININSVEFPPAYPQLRNSTIPPSYIERSAYGNMFYEPLLYVEVVDQEKLVTEMHEHEACSVSRVLDFAVVKVNKAISMGNRNSEHKEDYIINHCDELGVTLYINKNHCKGTDAIPVTKLIRPLVSILIGHCVDFNYDKLSQEWKDYLNYKTDVLAGEHEDETLDTFTFTDDSSNQIAHSNSEFLESITEFSDGEKNYDNFANRFIK